MRACYLLSDRSSSTSCILLIDFAALSGNNNTRKQKNAAKNIASAKTLNSATTST